MAPGSARLEVGEEDRALLTVGLLAHQHDGDVEAGGGGPHQREQLGRDDGGLRSGVGQDVAQLGLGLQEDHRGHDGPRAPDGPVADEHLRGVHHHHRDAIAGLDTEAAEPGAGAGRTIVDLARGVPAALEAEGVVVAQELVAALRQQGQVAVAGGAAHRGSSSAPTSSWTSPPWLGGGCASTIAVDSAVRAPRPGGGPSTVLLRAGRRLRERTSPVGAGAHACREWPV